jgi:hypothetical protein
MKQLLLIPAMAVLLCGQIHAQEPMEGKLRIIQDARVDTLLTHYLKYSETYPGIEGWRIEIFFEAGNYSKKMAMEAKSDFVQKHPEIPSYLIFQQPYYKVRVGDFRSKMKAEELLRSIESDYPQAFVVVDEINFPRLD